MTIHHDKLAYGKLASSMEELSEKQIEEMLKQLQEDESELLPQKEDEKNKKNL